MVWTVIIFMQFVFFFKQKTAYEMRISDWSSDVCSSDLLATSGRASAPARTGRTLWAPLSALTSWLRPPRCRRARHDLDALDPVRLAEPLRNQRGYGAEHQDEDAPRGVRVRRRPRPAAGPRRSEEHTSELQSLMRISD